MKLHPVHAPFFTGNRLDRRDAWRADQSRLNTLLGDSALRIIGFRELKPLMDVSDGLQPCPLGSPALPDDWRSQLPWIFLGTDAGQPIIAVDLDPLPPATYETLIDETVKAIDLRSIAMQLGTAEKDGGMAAMLACGKAVLDWHQRHQFCAVCGGETRMERAGFARVCLSDACGANHFPRTDPVVIMLAVNGDRCILGRQEKFLPGVFSALAGFMEPGESIEEAVARELQEEAGLNTSSVRYFASQPWPFPSSLMIGCVADVDFADPVLDDELEEACWFTREELSRAVRRDDGCRPVLPSEMAIGYQLVRAWVQGEI